ncbi:MAG: ABC transporter permease [Desulfuromonadales bacterium]|nr:ABC transporter permease [Desulfuromonadales bacterium]
MMINYFMAFFRANRTKVLLLVASVASYFAIVALALSLERSVNDIATLPLQSIGVQTIVQKEGEIPEQMTGAVFPHSNAPISTEEYARLSGLDFVRATDRGLYFWYFGQERFIAALGVEPGSKIFADILAANLARGSFGFAGQQILVTQDFAAKTGVDVGDVVTIGQDRFPVGGVLKANLSGNIIPADIYMGIDDAVTLVGSGQMPSLYHLTDDSYGNVVLLQSDPQSNLDKEKPIKEINAKLLVFSEKTFTREIKQQLKIVSSAGKAVFAVIGLLLVTAFGLMVSYNLKTREKDIALLRILSWTLRDLKKQFLGETLLLFTGAILLGNLLVFAGIYALSGLTVSMELPWDISARPHFLPAENAIERIITSTIPLAYDPFLAFGVTLGFLLIFLSISLVLLRRLKKMKPLDLQIG